MMLRLLRFGNSSHVENVPEHWNAPQARDGAPLALVAAFEGEGVTMSLLHYLTPDRAGLETASAPRK